MMKKSKTKLILGGIIILAAVVCAIASLYVANASTATSVANTKYSSLFDLSITDTLMYGSKGNDVSMLQKRLVALGLNIGSSTPDCDFGYKTHTAVRAVQKYSNIAVDGIVGKSQTEPVINQLMGTNTPTQKSALVKNQTAFLAEVVNPYTVYTYEDMVTDISQLQSKYSGILTVDSIGSSLEGRDIPLIKLGKGSKKILLNASHHAREYMSTSLLMKMAETYSSAYTNNTPIGTFNISDLLNKVTIYIVPMVNPDGVTIAQFGTAKTKNPELVSKINGGSTDFSSWKANGRGVDLNMQYPYEWDKKQSKPSASSEGYKGTAAATEPEVKAMIALTNANSFAIHVAYHTQGQIIYWYNGQAGSLYTQSYNIGTSLAALTGYRLLTISEQTSSYAGYKDWTVTTFKKPGYTIELCPYVGNYAYPDYKFNDVWNKAGSTGLFMAKEALSLD